MLPGTAPVCRACTHWAHEPRCSAGRAARERNKEEQAEYPVREHARAQARPPCGMPPTHARVRRSCRQRARQARQTRSALCAAAARARAHAASADAPAGDVSNAAASASASDVAGSRRGASAGASNQYSLPSMAKSTVPRLSSGCSTASSRTPLGSTRQKSSKATGARALDLAAHPRVRGAGDAGTSTFPARAGVRARRGAGGLESTSASKTGRAPGPAPAPYGARRGRAGLA
jgi:hypothetical protein